MLFQSAHIPVQHMEDEEEQVEKANRDDEMQNKEMLE
jgi:hypothetical protein